MPGRRPNLLTGIVMEEDPLVKVSLCQHVQFILSVERFPVEAEVQVSA